MVGVGEVLRGLVITVAALLLLASTAWAEDRLDVAVFELEGDGVDEDLRATLTAVLRQEALQHSGYSLVTPAAIARQDIALVLGCDATRVSCLREIANYVDGQVLIFGQVSQSARGLRIVVELLDVAAGTEPVRVERVLDSSRDPVTAFQREVESIFRHLDDLGETHLVIRAPSDDVEIRLEGVMVARGQVERTGLPPGSYRVALGTSDAPVWEGVVELAPGESIHVEPEVSPREMAHEEEAPAPESREAVEPREPYVPGAREEARVYLDAEPRSNAGAFSLIGTGALALGGSAAMVYLMRGVEQSIADENAAGTMTQARYDELSRRGRSFQGAHYMLLGAGTAAILFGGTWVIVNQRRNARIEDARRSSLALRLQGTHLTVEVEW